MIPDNLLDLLSSADRAVRLQGVELARSMGLGDHPVVRLAERVRFLGQGNQIAKDAASQASTWGRSRAEALMRLLTALQARPWVVTGTVGGEPLRCESRERAERAARSFCWPGKATIQRWDEMTTEEAR